MKHLPVKLTRNRRANFEKLARYLLKTYPRNSEYPSFRMESFYTTIGSLWLTDSECNTAACALGHGPAAGIGRMSMKPSHLFDNFRWHAYSDRHFINSAVEHAWRWCFSSDWEGVDDTPRGAAKRILYMLKYGVPENYERQISGYERLSYLKIQLQ